MTTRPAAYGHESAATPLDRLLGLRVSVNWETAIALAALAAAFAIRFWDLGAMALHHDESIHAQWSWRLAQGDYIHDPVFHGPLYYHAQGLVFLLAGASDYTARVSAAIFGTALVALPLLLRRRLGTAGTIAAMAFLAFSPTIVYYSRFFREDIYMAFFTMLMVVAMWRYMAEGRERWLVALAVAFAASMSTKEATFLTAAVFLVYLNGYVAIELAQATLRGRGTAETWRGPVLAAAIFPYAWAVAALWPFLGGLRRRAEWSEFPRAGDVLVLLGTLTVPLITRTLKWPLLELGIIEPGRLNWESVCHGGLPTHGRDQLALGGLFAVTASAAAFVGLQWRPRTWLICAGAAAGIYLTLMTSVWTNLEGLCTGPWGGLDYWISQQDVRRGDQPWFYYFMLMPAYEFLPLALALVGAYWAAVRGDAFSRFLIFWAVGMWAALSYAGEKMPWLNVHLALPVCLLAAWTLSYAWRAWTPRPSLSRVMVPLLSAAAIAMGATVVVAFLPGGGVATIVRVVVAAVAVFLIVLAARPLGRPAVPVFVLAAIVGALSMFSLRTMVMAVYERADVPKDLLIYTQSSPRISGLDDDIDELAAASGKGFNLRIAVDSTDSFAWPWAWYLRDYTSVSYTEFPEGPPAGDWDVLLVNYANAEKVNNWIAQTGSTRYGSPRRYEHRWWFDEKYKAALSNKEGVGCTGSGGDCGPWNPSTWRKIGSNLFGGANWLETWFYYWRDHDPDRGTVADPERACKTCGSVDGFAYFPANFDLATGKLSIRSLDPAKPGQDRAGRPAFGSFGNLPGQFITPVDVEADAQGNLYVIDSSSKRLQKFDPAGNFLASVDIRSDPNNPNEAAQPWGLGIAPTGEVIVADTFGWRMRVFDASLRQVASFGEPPGQGATPGNFELFGPRDAAIDVRGRVWVTDTGHDRVMVYSLKGEFIKQVGGSGSRQGQFDEPVGIEIGSDGTIYVADMYNRRVQTLDPEGAYRGEFPVEGWGGQGVSDKPYIQPLRDGRVAVGLPDGNEVRVYDRSGSVVATISGGDERLGRPYGIVETPDGRLWIVEGATMRLRLFEIP